MAEIYVTSTADSGAGSLRQAIADASDGDVILFDSDVFPAGTTTSILLSTYLAINKSISIYGGEADGAGGYTSGAIKQYYVYREVEGVRTKVVVDDDNPAQDDETVLFENICRVALDGQETTLCLRPNSTRNAEFVGSGLLIKNGASNVGSALYALNTSINTLNDCQIENCSSPSSGGAFYTANTNTNTLNGCVIAGCSAPNGGGGVYSTSTSQNILNGCIITGCSATDGGGVSSGSTSQNTLNGCIIDGCSATSGGGVYSTNTSQNTLNNCVLDGCSATNGGGVYSTSTSQNTLNGCNFDASSTVYVTNTSALIITGGITTIAAATLNAATITINDGAALTITTAATVGAATFTSDGRGYLAVAAGIDTSAATLTNVVLCSYGADVSSFAEVDGVLEWDAANPSTTVLIERADGDSWSTVTQTAGESLTLYLPPSDTVRLFDGVQFFTAQAPSQRTYYYIGGSEGSFTSAADWSLRRGGVAITEPPVVAGQRFIVGDISSGE